MRAAFILLVLVVMAVPALGAHDAPSAPRLWSNTRPVTPDAWALLESAAARSPSVRAMLEALEQTDVVVYVCNTDGTRADVRAFLRFLTTAAGRRYLAVHVDRWHASPAERIGWLGHELQHALEIAGAPEVVDAASLANFYQRVGWQCDPRRYESEAAKEMTRAVRNELAGVIR